MKRVEPTSWSGVVSWDFLMVGCDFLMVTQVRVLGVARADSAQARRSSGVSMVAKATLGWSHEFASDRAESWASFSGLSGSGSQVTSAPIGRDAALIGLLADVKVASWPMSVFAGYGGAINGSSDAQALNVGVHFIW